MGVGSEAWIQSGTIKYNILLGKQYNYDSDRYYWAIKSTSLSQDLVEFPLGD